jgi:ketosteroid isomerase-like protein
MDPTTIQDTLNIQQLYARYSDAIMRNDAEAFGSCWSDDAYWLLLGSEFRGRETIVQAYSNSVAGTDFIMHLAVSPLISIKGNRAKVRSQVQELLHFSGGGAMIILANYNDELHKIDGQWFFADRRISVRYSGPFPMDDHAFLPLPPDAAKPLT